MASTINFLRLLADPTRLRLLLLLEEDELTVAELQKILGMGQSRISSHLAQLKRASVVEDRRSGKNVYYGLTAKQERNPARAKVSELIHVLAREMPETARDRTGPGPSGVPRGRGGGPGVLGTARAPRRPTRLESEA